MNSSDNAYIEVLQERMQKIQERKRRLQEKKKSLLSINNIIDKEISGLDVEYNKLKEEVDAHAARITIGDLGEKALSIYDEKYASNEDKIKKYSEEIQRLNDTKSGMQTMHAKNVIDRKIKHINDKIAKLKSKNVNIGKTQRTLLLPKYKVIHRKENKINRAEGVVNFNQSRVDDNQMLKEAIGENAWFKSTRERYYDIKGMYYKKQLDKSKAHLDKMKDKYSDVRVHGGRIMDLPRRAVDRIRRATPAPSGPTPAPAV